MWFPVDPDKRPELWDTLLENLQQMSVALLVRDGRIVNGAVASPLTDQDTRDVLNAFRLSEIKRIGSSRGNAVPPHAGFKVVKRTALVTDLITATTNVDEITHDLESLAVSVFHDYPAIEAVEFPADLLGKDSATITRDAVAC
jgi:hypothetical protein